jgi:hypothetical protein
MKKLCTAELTNWDTRLNKSEVDGSPRFGRLVASTPKGAWEKEQHHQRRDCGWDAVIDHHELDSA